MQLEIERFLEFFVTLYLYLLMITCTQFIKESRDWKELDVKGCDLIMSWTKFCLTSKLKFFAEVQDSFPRRNWNGKMWKKLNSSPDYAKSTPCIVVTCRLCFYSEINMASSTLLCRLREYNYFSRFWRVSKM